MKRIAAALAAVGLIAGIAVAATAPGAQRPTRLTATIRLSSTSVDIGGVVRGEVVFHNPSSQPRVMLHSCATDGLFAISFRAANGYMTAPSFSAVGCEGDLPQNELIARPGTTVLRFRTRALYDGCTAGPQAVTTRYAPGWMPACLTGDRIPPLPAGAYSVVFVPDVGAGPYTGPHVTPVPLEVRSTG